VVEDTCGGGTTLVAGLPSAFDNFMRALSQVEVVGRNAIGLEQFDSTAVWNGWPASAGVAQWWPIGVLNPDVADEVLSRHNLADRERPESR